MGQVSVSIGGRSYKLSCGDGEEAHLEALAGHLDAKAGELTRALGAMSEPRLLLMAGIQLADELHALRHAPAAATASPDPAGMLARAEALADALEASLEA